MNLTEKIAYIRGLCEGLNLDESKPEVKVMNAIIDLLDDMSYSVTDMEDLYDELSAQVDEIDQDLAEAETELYGEDDDFDYDDDEDDEENEDDAFYEVTCDSLFAVKDVREVKLKKFTAVRALNFALKENILGYIKLLTA